MQKANLIPKKSENEGPCLTFVLTRHNTHQERENNMFGSVSSKAPATCQQQPTLLKWRDKAKQALTCLLQHKPIVQVVSPPVLDINVLAQEVLDDIHRVHFEDGGKGIIKHSRDCRGMSSCGSVLYDLCQYLPELNRSLPSMNSFNVVDGIQGVLSHFHCPHIWLFQNCESLLRSNMEQRSFIDFLRQLSQLPNTSVIFTTSVVIPSTTGMGIMKVLSSGEVCCDDFPRTTRPNDQPVITARTTSHLEGQVRNSLTPLFANIRYKERQQILEVIRQRRKVLQVCGPPLVGKSILVLQALNDLQQDASFRGRICKHHIVCKGLTSFGHVIDAVCRYIPTMNQHRDNINMYNIVDHIQEAMKPSCTKEHIWIFHNCESLLQNKDEVEIMFKLLAQQLPNTSVIYTTYKQFPTNTLSTAVVNVNMLADFWELVSVLKFYAPNVQVVKYVHVLLHNNLCLPSAVRHLAEKYLQNRSHPLTPDALELELRDNMIEFLNELWNHRLKDVPCWLNPETSKLLVHFSGTTNGLFSKELFREVVCPDDNDGDSDDNWLRKLEQLKNDYVIREEESDGKLRVHPLLVFFCMANPGILVQRGDYFDRSCNKFVKFLCRVLTHLNQTTLQYGQKSAIYGCMLQEWPNLRHTIQMAIHCNDNTYQAFWQVADQGYKLFTKFFPNEAQDFYQSLTLSANQYGTPLEKSVMEFHLGNAILFSTKANNRTEAGEYFQSSLNSLKASANTTPYYKILVYFKIGVLAHLQGDYVRSKEYFTLAEKTYQDRHTVQGHGLMYVSEARYDEIMISLKIYTTIPLIFRGDFKEAREILSTVLAYLETNRLYHPDLSTALNLMGLLEERENGSSEHALMFYEQSLIERKYLEKTCPQSMLVPLNNFAILLATFGRTEYALDLLKQALTISKATNYKSYHTALTLYHKADVNFRIGRFQVAHKSAEEANEIIEASSKEHEIRLKMNFILAHTSLIGIHQELDYSLQPPEFYLQEVQGLHARMSDNSSEEGYHLMLSSYEHILMLNWQNSPQKFEHFRSKLRDVFTKDPWILNELEKQEDKRHDLINGDIRVFYALCNRDLDLSEFVHLVCRNCFMCRKHAGSETVWKDVAEGLTRQRHQRNLFLGIAKSDPVNETLSQTFRKIAISESAAGNPNDEILLTQNSETSRKLPFVFRNSNIVQAQEEALNAYRQCNDTAPPAGSTRTSNTREPVEQPWGSSMDELAEIDQSEEAQASSAVKNVKEDDETTGT